MQTISMQTISMQVQREAGLTINEAIARLISPQGSSIKRTAWDEGIYVVFNNPIFVIDDVPYQPTKEDYDTPDWEAVVYDLT